MKTKTNSKQKAPYTKMELYTDTDLMALFKVTASCLYRWRRQQQLPYIKIGSSVYYLKKEINSMLKYKSKMSIFKEE